MDPVLASTVGSAAGLIPAVEDHKRAARSAMDAGLGPIEGRSPMDESSGNTHSAQHDGLLVDDGETPWVYHHQAQQGGLQGRPPFLTDA